VVVDINSPIKYEKNSLDQSVDWHLIHIKPSIASIDLSRGREQYDYAPIELNGWCRKCLRLRKKTLKIQI
jgi:hypothetical protein